MGGTSGPIESLVFGGDDSSPTPVESPVVTGASTPNLFKPMNQYMPQQYFGNQQIRNPNDILSAYMNNMPAFLDASRSQPIMNKGGR